MTNKPKMIKTASIRGLDVSYVPHADWAGITKEIFSNERSVNIETLYNVLKVCPEACACVIAKIEDIMADYWKFASPSNSEKTSKAALDKAKEFEIKARYYSAMTDALFD